MDSPRPAPHPKPARFHYAWVVAVAGGIAALIGVEPMALFGVFLGPISDDLGVSRGAVSSVYWVAFVCLGISSFLAGWAVDKIGLRKTLILTTIFTVIPLALLSLATQLWQVYLFYGVLYGIARGGFTIPILVTITMWFKKKQGVAVGIVSSGLGIGPMLFAPALRYLIDSFGWGNAFLVLGIASGVILSPCCWLIRSRPSDMGLQPYGEETTATQAAVRPDKAPAHPPLFFRKDVPSFFRYAMTTQPFVLLPLIHLAGCVSHAIPLAHVVSLATDRGIDPIAAATVLGFANGLSALTRFVAPMWADRIGGRKVLMLFLSVQAISMLLLLPANDLWVFYSFSLFFGLALGGEMTPFPVINRQYYGTANIGTVFGFQAMLASIGMGLGGFIGGYLYDLMGNYNGAIIVATGMGLLGAALAYILIDPFKRPKVTAAPTPQTT